MELVNTKRRSYNGIKFGETIRIDDKENDRIADYLENGFEKVGKEEIKTVVKNNAPTGSNLDLTKKETIKKAGKEKNK